MKSLRYQLLVIMLMGYMAVWAQVPTITNFSPQSGPIGTSVTITGTNFSATPANNRVNFGGLTAIVTTASSTSLTVTVPAGASFSPIQVEVGGLVATTTKVFTVTTVCLNSTFAANVDYATASGSYFVAEGDFNGDGNLDLAVTNAANNKLSVLLGVGDGTFGPKVDYVTSDSNPYSVAVGDFNGDRNQDLVVSNYNTSTVSIFLGTGTGTFGVQVDYVCGGNNHSVAVGDFNGDGNQDLVVSNLGIDDFSVLLGNGNGTFGARVSYSTGISPSPAMVGDFNGDGKQDLATANSGSNTISVFLGTGTGTFAAKVDYATGVAPEFLAIGDFNGDGNQDFAVVNYTSNTFSILLGTGTGTFGAKVDYATVVKPAHIKVGDFNGDGKQDLAVTSQYSNTVSVMLGTGTGTFGAKVDYTTAGNNRFMEVGDFNKDGKHDLVVSNNANTVSVLLNTCTAVPVITNLNPLSGAVGTSVTISGSGFSTTPSNNKVTFDGIPATVTAASAYSLIVTVPVGASYNKIQVEVGSLVATSAQSFNVITTPVCTGVWTKIDYATGTTPYFAAVGDFNKDGHQDVAVANYGSNSVSVLLGNGTGTFATKVDYAVVSTPRCLAVGDFNGDGIQDLAVANSGAGSNAKISVLIGTGTGTFNASVNYTTGNQPNSVAIGDFNKDGKQDLVTANYASTSISVLLGNGDGTFAAKVDYTTGNAPFSVSVRDLNGDGNQDVVATNLSSSSFSFFSGTGTGTFNPKVDYSTGAGPAASVIEDFNGDGIMDLVVANSSANNLSVFIGTGAGAFAPSVNYAAGAGPNHISVGDFNKDGKLDLVVPSLASNTISIYAGTGTGTFAAKVDYATGTQPLSAMVADFDEDGFQDLVVPNSVSNTVSIFKEVCVPVINSISPLSGSVGTSVTLTGINFSSTASANKVTFGGVAASVTSASTTSLTVPVPAGASYNPVQVKVGGLVATSLQTFNTINPVVCFDTLSRTDYPSSAGNYFAAIGDFNKDGHQDVASLNYSSNTISVSLGNGTGVLGAATNYSVGSIPRYVAVGDFNGDGNQDLVSANSSSATISVLLGTGSGTFGASVNYTTGTTPFSIGVGDFNGDGKQDLAVTNYGSNNVSIFIGIGNGIFLTKVDYTTGTNPNSIAISDFNNDGKQDLAVANYGSGSVSILQGTGGGTFGTKSDKTSGTNPRSVVTGDFNGDGNQDLATANNGSNTISVLLGNGIGAFSTKVDYATGAAPFTIAEGDIDADGKLDLFTPNNSANTISILRGTGTGTFSAKTDYTTPSLPVSAALGDFNEDGKHDMVVLSNNNISVFLSTAICIPTITTAAIIPTNFCSGATATITYTKSSGNFNAGNKFKVQLSNASGSFASPTLLDSITSVNVTPIVVTIPALSGAGYRIRVVSTNPAVNGSDNGTNLTLTPSTTPSVSISATASTICTGTNVTFTAIPTNGGSTPSYQWKIGSTNVGANSATYSNAGLSNGNVITCVMTSNAVCTSPAAATSNAITMAVTASSAPSVSISAADTTICVGGNAVFTALPVLGGTTPSYQWKVNGSNVGINSPNYSNTTLTGTDVVTVVMTSNASCASPLAATSPGFSIIEKDNQIITFPPISDLDVLATLVLNATSSSGLSVSYSSSNPSIVSFSGNTPTLNSIGTVTITASQAGDNCFNPASNVSRTFSVTGRINQTITINPISSVNFGTPQLITATASSGLPVTVVSSDPTIGLIIGGQLVALKNGTITLTASQAGDASYYPAPDVVQTITLVVPPFTIVGKSKVDEYSVEDYFISPVLPGLTYAWGYSQSNILYLSGQVSSSFTVFYKNTTPNGTLTCVLTDPISNISIPVNTDITVFHAVNNGLQPIQCDSIQSTFLACSGNYINGFSLSNISNAISGCSSTGIQDFTIDAYIGELFLGESYNASITIGTNPSAVKTNNYVGIWLDYNNNASFDDAGEFLLSTYSPDSVIALNNIIISTNNEYADQELRLRVRVRASGIFSQSEYCLDFNESGETEDYKVKLKAPDRLEAPVLITPDNDGKNDFFVIRGIISFDKKTNTKVSNKLTILDRAGNVLFVKEDYDNTWEGKGNDGKLLPRDTYYYNFVNGDALIRGYFEIRYE